MVVVASCHWDSRYTPIWKGWGGGGMVPPRACDPAIPYPPDTSNPGADEHRGGSNYVMPVLSVLLAVSASLANRGVLCFGAARGPPSHLPERDGRWQPGYWVQLRSGETFIVPRSRIDAGLREGDDCCLRYDSDGPCAATISEKQPPLEPSRFVLPPTVQRAAVTVFVTAAAGAVLSGARPVPGAYEAVERCGRLISGAVEARERATAEGWLARCDDLAASDAERVLDDAWAARWGTSAPSDEVRRVSE
jgi:hypothetical protein